MGIVGLTYNSKPIKLTDEMFDLYMPARPKYGDVLRYPLSEDPSDSWRFMFITRSYSHSEVIETIVLRTHPSDDVWVVGDLATAGINELEIVPE